MSAGYVGVVAFEDVKQRCHYRERGSLCYRHNCADGSKKTEGEVPGYQTERGVCLRRENWDRAVP